MLNSEQKSPKLVQDSKMKEKEKVDLKMKTMFAGV